VIRSGAIAVGWLLVCWINARVLNLIIEPSALASLADDSSNYLVMARCFSPWSAPGVALSLCAQQYFPAGFSLLLALLGADGSLPLAHGVVLFCHALCMPMLWCCAAKVLESRMLAHLLAMCFAVLPGTLLGVQGILSESLYLLLVLAFFSLHGDTIARLDPRRAAAAGALLGLLVCVRSIGAVMIVAVLAQAAVSRLRGGGGECTSLWRVMGTALAVIAPVYLLFPPASTTGDYASIWVGLLSNPPEITGYIASQARALVDAWATFLALYWRADRLLVWAGMLGLLCVCLAWSCGFAPTSWTPGTLPVISPCWFSGRFRARWSVLSSR
jgi:hypothetical protein